MESGHPPGHSTHLAPLQGTDSVPAAVGPFPLRVHDETDFHMDLNKALWLSPDYFLTKEGRFLLNDHLYFGSGTRNVKSLKIEN